MSLRPVSISTLGSYLALEQRFGPAMPPAFGAVAGGVMPASGPDTLDLAGGSPQGLTLDDIEGDLPYEQLPTTLDPLPPTAGSGPVPAEVGFPVGSGGPVPATTGWPLGGVGPSQGYVYGRPADPVGGAAGQRTLRYGDRGGDVSALQRSLNALGFGVGDVDGVFGPRTRQALQQFQASRGLAADGQVGPLTRAQLDGTDAVSAAPATGIAPTPRRTPAQGPVRPMVQHRLVSNLANRFRGVRHQCFRYAWTMARSAGGRSIDSAPRTTSARNAPITALDSMINQGKLRTGDVVYVNRRPGADPSSTNLAFGPHWFVYIGNGKFADQYGVRGARAMQAFVPGRRIDTIYHPFQYA